VIWQLNEGGWTLIARATTGDVSNWVPITTWSKNLANFKNSWSSFKYTDSFMNASWSIFRIKQWCKWAAQSNIYFSSCTLNSNAQAKWKCAAPDMNYNSSNHTVDTVSSYKTEYSTLKWLSSWNWGHWDSSRWFQYYNSGVGNYISGVYGNTNMACTSRYSGNNPKFEVWRK